MIHAIYLLGVPGALLSQTSTTELITIARAHIAAHQLDSAEITLESALANARYTMDSVWVYIWYGALEHLHGRDSITRLSFRQALNMHANPDDPGLESVSPQLAELFDAESRGIRVYFGSDVDQRARWRSGPAFVYPAEQRRRHVAGPALVRAVVDTLGRVIDRTIEVLEVPDSAFIEPLTRMLSAASFDPARIKRHPVRSWVSYQFNLTPPAAKDPMHLVSAARELLEAHRADSALVLIDAALDGENGATPAIRMYALIVQGIARHSQGRDSLADVSFGAARGSYLDLKADRVDLAPFLLRLADSVHVRRLTPEREYRHVN